VALIQTPHRFRTKRQLWAYSGLALETRISAEYRLVEGQVRRSKKLLSIRGLNKDHNHDLKGLFKGAATMASVRPGPFQDFSARIRSLTKDDIRSLLRCGPIQFVVVDVGSSPRWIQPSECFQFWTSEAQPHLARQARVILEGFPGGYCYSASEWDGGDPAAPIVVLEKQH
jgi:hypothetical protein